MRICAAQIRPIRSDIEANIQKHLQLIDQAVLRGGELIVFPEMSITGYETDLARDLAFTAEDDRLKVFQDTSDLFNITVSLGAPLFHRDTMQIAAFTFSPSSSLNKSCIYIKNYLHPDEEEFFTAAAIDHNLIMRDPDVHLAICYEISVPEHSESARGEGTKVYFASVAKTKSGVEKAHSELAEIANRYRIYTLMANSVGPSADGFCAGSSAIWDQRGNLLEDLDEDQEGILILDTRTGQTKSYYL